jgi:hypothetical protein
VSRGLTTWNDETIKRIRDHFVAASVPTWVCRASSPGGEFLRGAGVDKQWVTSSGYMTCLSASGKLLGTKPDATVLKKFRELPEAERKPGAVQVANLRPSEVAIPSPPEGGLVLKVHARFLASDDDGKLRHAKTSDFPLMSNQPDVMRAWALFLQPNTEYMWLTREEWQSLVPAEPAKGQTLTVNPAISERMARFHLTPQRATTSEGGIVSKKSVKAARLSLLVSDVSPQQVRMRLEGFLRWGSDYEASKATTPNGPLAQGFETPVYGRLDYDRTNNAITRFDIVAPGHVWGRWGDANGKSMYVERPGRAPFGFAFELASGDSPSDRIPPGGNGNYVSEQTGYFSGSGPK